MAKANLKTGRPTKYSSKLASEICDAIASSSKGIRLLCKNNPHWPCSDTIFTWLKENADFSDQYARAKKCQVEFLVDEILEIADDVSHDCTVKDNGKITYNQSAINRAKLQIDTRKWLACKLVPKVYGSSYANRHCKDLMSQEENEQNCKELLALRTELAEKYKKEY